MPRIRKYHFIFLFLFLVQPLIRPQHGAYISPVIKFTSINGHGANFLGVKGGWVINNSIVVGAEYYALNSDITPNWIDPTVVFLPLLNLLLAG
jgi:hypothetical protein